jgi:hypothetical protein
MEAAAFIGSDGCRLAAVMEASKKSTATPLGGVSPMARVIGTPLIEDGLWFMEELQASSKTQLISASVKEMWPRIVEPPGSELKSTPD